MGKNGMKMALVLTLAALAAGCSETAQESAPQASIRSGSPSDERACLAAVSQQTQNSQVTVLSSEFSQANTLVMVGVGPDRAPWRCLVNGGIVAEVMSMTNEGSL